MKIGLFGGSFNPPHLIHHKIPMELINHHYLDKVIFIPTGDKFPKPGLVPFKNRMDMLNIMIKDNTNLSVSDIENKDNIRRYTYETLDYFKNLYNEEIFFIVGSDNLRDIVNWKEPEYILKNYKIIAIKRDEEAITEIIKEYSLLTKYKDSIIEFKEMECSNLSSTFVRNNINNNLLDCLDKEVINYIKENHLYE